MTGSNNGMAGEGDSWGRGELKLTENTGELADRRAESLRTKGSYRSDEMRGSNHNTKAEGRPTTSAQRTDQKQPKTIGLDQPINPEDRAMYDAPEYKSPAGRSHNSEYQIEEILRKAQPSYEKRMSKINVTLQTLKQIIEHLPDQEPLTVSEAEEVLLKEHNVRIPFPDPRPSRDSRYTLLYAKPTNVNVTGSYSRQTSLKTSGQLTIDLVVTMPSKIFQENDYLNYRYFYKRAYYLSRIAVGLRVSKSAQLHVEYALQNDNHLQPIIIIRPHPCGQLGEFAPSKCQIKILLAVDGNLFPAAKTIPDRACLRSPSDSQNAKNKPTPFYNATIRSESCSLRYLGLLHRASCHSQGFKHACVLGSIWLRQRGFGAGLTCGGFGPFEWACIVALLMQGGGPHDRPILSKKYDRFQIFKATLEYLSVKNLSETSVSIGRGTFEVVGNEVPMLLDGAAGINILFKMTPWSYALLRHEVTCTLKLLNDPYTPHVDACFNTKINEPLQRFDFVATFSAGQSSIKATSSPTLDAHDSFTQMCFLAHQILKRALGDRAALIHLRSRTPSSWPIDTLASSPATMEGLLIELLLNPQHINRAVDRGPSADEKELAASFRGFWGNKAELRRFNDGSIRESLTWSSTSKQSILEQILIYALGNHLGCEAADSLLMLADSFNREPFGVSNDIPVLRQPIMTAYEVLEKQLRALENTPLQIRSICPANTKLLSRSPSLTGEDEPPLQSIVSPHSHLSAWLATDRIMGCSSPSVCVASEGC